MLVKWAPGMILSATSRDTVHFMVPDEVCRKKINWRNIFWICHHNFSCLPATFLLYNTFRSPWITSDILSWHQHQKPLHFKKRYQVWRQGLSLGGILTLYWSKLKRLWNLASVEQRRGRGSKHITDNLSVSIQLLYAYVRRQWKLSTSHNYRQISNISHTQFQILNVSCLVSQLSLPNSLKPDVKPRIKMQLEQRRQAMLQLHLSDQHFYCLLRWDLY